MRSAMPFQIALASDLQLAAQPGVLSGEPGYIAVAQHALFRTGQLACDQLRDVREPEDLIQRHQVRLDLAAAHQVEAGEQHAEDVESEGRSALRPYRAAGALSRIAATGLRMRCMACLFHTSPWVRKSCSMRRNCEST